LLLDGGCEVLCVDNFFTGTLGNVDELLNDRKFEILRRDVTLPLYVEVDEIYNLACPASPIHYQHDPVHTIKTSVMGAINALGLAKRLKARVLQASTSEVYGDRDVHPQPESYRGRQYHGSPGLTTKANAAPKRCSTTTVGSTNWISAWPASSILMGPKCIRRMVE
jgi:UDP-glucuronate decarboxylase